MLILCIILSVVLSLIFSPTFWIVVAILLVVSAVQRALERRKGEDETDDYTYRNTGASYTDAPYSNSGRTSDGDAPFSDDDYTEGTDDLNRIEQVYETNAVDVDDVEVVRNETEE